LDFGNNLSAFYRSSAVLFPNRQEEKKIRKLNLIW